MEFHYTDEIVDENKSKNFPCSNPIFAYFKSKLFGFNNVKYVMKTMIL